MGSFFIPPLRNGSRATEQTYRELRERTELHTGAASRDRRIEGVMCRRSGRDCLLRVGELDAANGQVVAAIIQVGRDTFTVHHLGDHPSQLPDPVVLRRSDVYSVTDFQ
jgi:hypothetical protein